MREDQLQRIPKANITKEIVVAQTQCFVCFDKFRFNEFDVRELPCKHLYHTKCIFPWLQRTPSCPYCRTELPHQDNVHLDDLEIGLSTLGTLGTAMSSMFDNVSLDIATMRARLRADMDSLRDQLNLQLTSVQRGRIRLADITTPGSSRSRIEQPNIEQPRIGQPIVEEPSIEQPSIEQPSIEQPSVERQQRQTTEEVSSSTGVAHDISTMRSSRRTAIRPRRRDTIYSLERQTSEEGSNLPRRTRRAAAVSARNAISGIFRR